MGKVHGYDKPLITNMKTEKAAKTLSQLASSTSMNQLQSVINMIIRGGLRSVGLKRKVPGTHQLLISKVFSQ